MDDLLDRRMEEGSSSNSSAGDLSSLDGLVPIKTDIQFYWDPAPSSKSPGSENLKPLKKLPHKFLTRKLQQAFVAKRKHRVNEEHEPLIS
ncbi:expressed unknown protein [Seminavis robusta]|uniref:Uncharacterized protein n=1 Tax=Seminavis robusta TaxID=568900 RepID=A0A9N8H188_9STRA|nr:expressed unknown protein [Seminavis robusta]|eukprot:Sro1_g000410.1 n/a (90) ;mRNA; r:115237-115506